MDYAQAQQEELEVLQAIYMEDFEEVKTKRAWNSTDKAFNLRLKAPSDDTISLILSVKLTATYPKTLPILSQTFSPEVPGSAIREVKSLLMTKPAELLGEVMIHELATSIQDILEDAAQQQIARQQKADAAPSLDEERAVQEAAAKQIAMQQQSELQKQKEAEQAEEQRGLQDMVDREMSKREKRRARPSHPAILSPVDGAHMFEGDSADNAVDFQRPITMNIEGSVTDFSAVNRVVQIRKGALTKVMTAQPCTAQAPTIATCLILKRIQISGSNQKARDSQVKKGIFDLERELEQLKSLRHESAINVLEYSIESNIDAAWDISILVEYANKGSLQEMLEMVASAPSENVRIWTIQILEALDFYHRNGIVHKRIHADNVLLSRSMLTGATAVKLSDASFQDELYTINDLTSTKAKLPTLFAPKWPPPELASERKKTRKTDIWEAGVVFVQMLFGLDATKKYVSPVSMFNALGLSEPLEELLIAFFREDPKRRPTAFDLIPNEFFRSDAPILEEVLDRVSSTVSVPQALNRNNRGRRGSSLGFGHPVSRYGSEWVEVGRLGKGGYGEVVKARNKLDGRVYAIKKIVSKSPSELSNLLSEVMLLSRLNHPYVVRYYTAWPEEEFASELDATDEDTTTATATSDAEPSFDMKPTLDFGPSSRGLDFVSSSGFKIQFGNDSDDSDGDSEGGEGDISKGKSLKLRRTTSSSRSARPTKSTLYIQMEYCERHTLRDLILRELPYSPEESWRLFRQILEGLVHIHSHGIIHRDLKPDNIFIDVTNNPRIGDFGLATSGQYQLADRVNSGLSAPNDSQSQPGNRGTGTMGDMTRSVGTALYVAPELRSDATGAGNYNDKVDMYSFGIIFFEMCYPLKTAMERLTVLKRIREKEHTLPQEFNMPEKALQGEVIMSLISHRPSERPSSVELLRSGKVPLQIEDETIQEALRGLSDPSSPYYQKMTSALFAQSADSQVKDFTWDLKSSSNQIKPGDNAAIVDSLMRNQVKETLMAIYRRHGASEDPRTGVFPFSAHYSNSNAVKLLDPSGTLVQLPYDLTVPYARRLAKQQPPADKTFAFSNVYRDTFTGGAPHSHGEADFDIISHSSQDLALKEAEVIKVVDEIVEAFPSLNASQMCFHVNHSNLLDFIMDFCRISKPQRPAVKEVISKLNLHGNTWQKVRSELRAPTLGVSSTSLDDLSRFDFRDTPEKAFKKIESIFEGTELLGKLGPTYDHLRTLLKYLKQFHVSAKVYISPLSSFNEKFYSRGILFQCLYDTKKRTVLAAGGRYDSLVEEYRPKVHGAPFVSTHAVGVNIGWDNLVASMARHYRSDVKKSSRKSQNKDDEEDAPSALRRCDTLVAAFDPKILRTTGIKILSELWKHDMNAELAVDTRSVEDLQSHYRDEKYNWIIMVKQDSVNSGKPELKIRNLVTKEDSDVYTSNLIQHMRSELRDREQREGERARLRHHTSQPDSATANISTATRATNNVQVLMAQHRSKKSNKWNVVEAAQTRARELLGSYSNAPIVAVETRDENLERIRATRLSDAESWRKAIQVAPLNERQYLGQVQDMLETYAKTRREGGGVDGADVEEEGGEGGRVVFVYNFRTGACMMYDLAL
ncbi:kinase-like protein [Rhizodiscina lignyota]|uniref:non-specific serine/threonine protein kinase n=1 Tax=Rhizodiscina lignyota TaxID=1504668 RepID=A0A9P4M5G5_9PEZI|nr:kinase-like protein [Rhizodiscina lignyota]